MEHFEAKWWMVWTSWVLCLFIIVGVALLPYVYVEPNGFGIFIPDVGGYHFTYEPL